MALVDRRVLVEYAVGGPTLWHERLVLAHVADDRYIIVTPDGDVYEEELGLLNSDIRNIRVRARPGAVPAGVVAAQIYGLPAWGAGQLQPFRDEAQRLVGQPVPAAAPAPGPAVAVGVRGFQSVALDEMVGYPAGRLKWLAAEAAHEVKYAHDHDKGRQACVGWGWW